MDQNNRFEKETLFLRIKKSSVLQGFEANEEVHSFEEYRDNSSHFLEIITS